MNSLASGHRSGFYSKIGCKSQEDFLQREKGYLMEVNDNTGIADSYLTDNRNKR